MLSVVLGVLATWRLSTLLYWEKGPFDLCQKLRDRACLYRDAEGQPMSWLGRQLLCYWCVTFWVGFAVAPLAYFAPWLLWPLALSAGAVLLSQGGRTIWRAMED